MQRVTGLGGIFFKSNDPKKIREWYRTHLGIDAAEDGAVFRWRDIDEPERTGSTVWSAFPTETKYFAPSDKPFMINYRVKDLKALLDELRKEGVTVVGQIEEYDYGKFGWILDPEGNKIELWEPVNTTTP